MASLPQPSPPSQPRSPQEIRASIEANRVQLGDAVAKLRSEIAVATDWRRQLQAHKKQVMIAAAVAGFVVGGGLAVLGRRRRR